MCSLFLFDSHLPSFIVVRSHWLSRDLGVFSLTFMCFLQLTLVYPSWLFSLLPLFNWSRAPLLILVRSRCILVDSLVLSLTLLSSHWFLCDVVDSPVLSLTLMPCHWLMLSLWLSCTVSHSVVFPCYARVLSLTLDYSRWLSYALIDYPVPLLILVWSLWLSCTFVDFCVLS